MHEKLHQVTTMRLVGFRGQTDLHRTDNLSIDFRDAEDNAALLDGVSDIAPISGCVFRAEGQHETERGAAIDAIGQNFAKVRNGGASACRVENADGGNHAVFLAPGQRPRLRITA